MNLDTDITTFTKLLKINTKCKTMQFLEDKIGENLYELGYEDNFLDIAPKHYP